MSDILISPPVIDPKIKEEILAMEQTEKQVIVHCHIRSEYLPGTFIRIWPQTYLINESQGIKNQMIHHENIVLAPDWLMVPFGMSYGFTLIFPGLPDSCKVFDLREIIPEEGAFHVKNIRRNTTDVYSVRLF